MHYIFHHAIFILIVCVYQYCQGTDHRIHLGQDDESSSFLACKLGNEKTIEIPLKLLRALDAHLIHLIEADLADLKTIDVPAIKDERAMIRFLKTICHEHISESTALAFEEFVSISDYLGIAPHKVTHILMQSASSKAGNLIALMHAYVERKNVEQHTESYMRDAIKELSPHFIKQRLGAPRNLDGFIGHTKTVTCICAIDESTLATGSLDHTIIIWKKNMLDEWVLSQRLGNLDNEDITLGHTDWIASIQKTEDGHLLSFGEQAIIWLQDENGLWQIEQQIINTPDMQTLYEGAINAIPSIHLDKQKIIVGYGDRTAMIWQDIQGRWMPTEQIGITLNTNPALGHIGNIIGFAHIDQHTFATISEDRTAIIWQKNADTFCSKILPQQ